MKRHLEKAHAKATPHDKAWTLRARGKHGTQPKETLTKRPLRS